MLIKARKRPLRGVVDARNTFCNHFEGGAPPDDYIQKEKVVKAVKVVCVSVCEKINNLICVCVSVCEKIK